MNKKTKESSLFTLFQLGISIQRLNKMSEKRFSLSIVQWCLLSRLLDRPCISAYSLSATVGVHPSTLTQTLRRLEKKGWVFMTEDPRDSRKKLISITRAGKEALDEVRAQMRESFDFTNDINHDMEKVQAHLSRKLRIRSR